LSNLSATHSVSIELPIISVVYGIFIVCYFIIVGDEVFSDHGSHFYRGVSDDGNSIVSSKLKRLDNLGSIFAIYPKDVCSNVFKKTMK